MLVRKFLELKSISVLVYVAQKRLIALGKILIAVVGDNFTLVSLLNDNTVKITGLFAVR